MRNPQRSQQEWRQLFKQQQHSGLSAVEFCRQQHINIQTFYARRSDIRLLQTQGKFVQVKREVTTVESQEFILIRIKVCPLQPSLLSTFLSPVLYC